MSQKVSPGAAWVIRATFIRGVAATCPPPPSFATLFGLPPVLEHALRAIRGITAAVAAIRRRDAFFKRKSPSIPVGSGI
jgi:hypothetical protein